MNPTLYRTEWVSYREDWDEPTEPHGHASFESTGADKEDSTETDNEDVLIPRSALADGLISELNRRYEFRGGLIVERFLRENLRQDSSLASVLLQAHGILRGSFHSGTRMILEVVMDPEFPADQQLFVIARTKLPRKIARQILPTVERGWWRSVPLEVRKKVELDVE